MLKTLLQEGVQRLLGILGLRLVPARCARTMGEALRVAAQRHPVATIVDVGASNGSWTRQALRHFPGAACLLIEAQAHPHEPALARLKARTPSVDYVIAAAGDREGTYHFDATDPLGGLASERPTGPHDIVVPATTVDREVARRGLQPPFLLKLDTHGFEVPILEGARETLRDTSLLVVEAYNFELTPGCLRFHELCVHLAARGFRCLDLVDVLHRPGDGVLWQMDLFFVPAASAELSRTTYLDVASGEGSRP